MYVGVETLAEARLDDYNVRMNGPDGNHAFIELRNRQNRIVQISVDGKGHVTLNSYIKSNKGETKFDGTLNGELSVSSRGILFFADDAVGKVRFTTYIEGEGDYGQKIFKVERIENMTEAQWKDFEKNKKGAAKKKAAL